MPCAIDSDDDSAHEPTQTTEDALRARLPRMGPSTSRDDALVYADRTPCGAVDLADDAARQVIVTSSLFAPVAFKRTTVIDVDTLRIREDVVTPAPREPRLLSRAYPCGAPRGVAARHRGAAYRVVATCGTGSVVLRAVGADASAVDLVADARDVALRDARPWTAWRSTGDLVVHARADVSGPAFLWRARRGFSVWLFSRNAARLERNLRRDSNHWVRACSASRRRCAVPKYTFIDVASSVGTASRRSSRTASPGRDE